MGGNALELIRASKGDPVIKAWMAKHYSAPKGFVGRQLLYKIVTDFGCLGAIAGGSATLHLPGREIIFHPFEINRVVNNTFFHVEKPAVGYPCRNFTTAVVAEWRRVVSTDWETNYADSVAGFETLVELPRSGELYRRDHWSLVGQTLGQTCKRIAGKGTDSWSGKRVWDTKNLRPKLVFCRAP